MIGSPTVFQTTPPQPASKARATISPVFVMGQEASQKGLGPRMPAMSVNRSTPGTVESAGRTEVMRGPPRPSASTMDAAASLPAWTACTTSAPPLAMSPMAQTLGSAVRPVAGSATTTRPVRGDPEGGCEAHRRALTHGPDDRVERTIEA